VLEFDLVIWTPYAPVIGDLPDLCKPSIHLWTARVPLISLTMLHIIFQIELCDSMVWHIIYRSSRHITGLILKLGSMLWRLPHGIIAICTLKKSKSSCCRMKSIMCGIGISRGAMIFIENNQISLLLSWLTLILLELL